MPYDPDRHHRHSTRLRGYDYRLPGLYFVTLCVHQRAWLFGDVVDGRMHVNAYGRVVGAVWAGIPAHASNVRLDTLQVMPNHMHGLIEITAMAGEGDPPEGTRLKGPAPGSLGAILGAFQSVVARRINDMRHTRGAPVWQRNYWDHIVRDEAELERIRAYIVSNPALWVKDRLYGPEKGDAEESATAA